MRERPLCGIAAVFALAVLCAFLLPDPRVAVILLPAAGLSGLFLLIRFPARRSVAILCLTASAAFGSFLLHHAREIAPLQGLAGQTVQIEGMVTAVRRSSSSVFYTVKAIFPGQEELPRGVMLSVRSRQGLEHAEGDFVRMTVLLSLPEEYGSARYYHSRGIYLLGSLAGESQAIKPFGFTLDSMALRWRQYLLRNLDSRLRGDTADVVAAMVLGAQDRVGADIYTQINKSGTVHLLSVSGLHLSVLAGCLLALLSYLRVGRQAASAVTIAAAFAFTLLVGFAAPVVRALLMTSVMLVARMSSRKSDPLSALGLAVLVICFVWPHWLLSRGMWLSAGSTLGILLLSKHGTDAIDRRLRLPDSLPGKLARGFLGAGMISLCAYAVTFPIFFLIFGWISLAAPLANLLIFPFITPSLLGGMICSLWGGDFFLLGAAGAVTEFCTRMILDISALISWLPFAVFSLDHAYLLPWLLVCVAAALALLLRGTRRGLAVYSALLAVVVLCAGDISLKAARRDTAELVTLAGCNSAVLLREDSAVILGSPSRYDVDILLRYLTFRGVRRVELVAAPDCPEQIDSGFLRLQKAYGIGAVVGPNDSYVLEQLSLFLPGVPVYSAGYARVRVLDGIELAYDLSADALLIDTPRERAVKIPKDAPKTPKDKTGEILLFKDGTMLAPPGRPPLAEPVGERLFGERRMTLHLV